MTQQKTDKLATIRLPDPRKPPPPHTVNNAQTRYLLRQQARTREHLYHLFRFITAEDLKALIERNIRKRNLKTIGAEHLDGLISAIIQPGNHSDLIYPHIGLDNPLLRTYWMATKLRTAFEDPTTLAWSGKALNGYNLWRFDPHRERAPTNKHFIRFRQMWCGYDPERDYMSSDRDLLEVVSTRDTVRFNTLLEVIMQLHHGRLIDSCATFDVHPMINAVREWESIAATVEEHKVRAGSLTSEPGENPRELTLPEGWVSVPQNLLEQFQSACASLPVLTKGGTAAIGESYAPMDVELFADCDPKLDPAHFNPMDFLFDSIDAMRQSRGWTTKHLSELTGRLGHTIYPSRLSNYRKKPDEVKLTLCEMAVLSESFRIPLSEWLFAITLDFMTKRPGA